MKQTPPKPKSLGCFIGTAAAAVFIVVAVWSVLQAIGIPVSGEAATAADIPYVGQDLTELDFTTPATFRCFEHPHGGGTCRLFATATPDSVRQFCRAADFPLAHEGPPLASREHILDFIGTHGFLIPEDVSDTESLVIFGTNQQFTKLYGLYDVPTERLWLNIQFPAS